MQGGPAGTLSLETIMRCGTKRLFITLALGLVVVSFAADVCAAERVRPMRISVLTSSWGPSPQTVGLRDGLLALGYREDQEFVIGIRFTQGDLTALPAAARDLVQYGVDLIFASQLFSAKVAQAATTRIPIVFSGGAGSGDPVEMGLVQSFVRPGGNITGVTDLDLELGPKRLEVFREIIPSLRRLLYIYEGNRPGEVAPREASGALCQRSNPGAGEGDRWEVRRHAAWLYLVEHRSPSPGYPCEAIRRMVMMEASHARFPESKWASLGAQN